ncbi:MAG: FG-GAP-like repeat-containing protein, partial [Phycisphaerales bacterium]
MTLSGRIAVLCVVAALPACGRNAPGPDAADIAANNRGVGLMGMYKYDEADDVFRALAAEHPDWVDVNVNLAIATFNRQQEGDETRAMEILLAALETDPDNLRARYCAGLLMYRSAQPGALDHLEFVARGDPDDPYAAYFYGSALEQADRTDEALAEYRRALDLDPYLRSAIYRMSRILLRSGRTDEGMTLQETFQKLADNPRARTIDFIYTKMGPKAEALAVGLSVPVSPSPSGPLFADAVPLLPAGPAEGWTQSAGVTACDINGDGRIDLFLAGALQTGNAVVLAGSDGFTLDTAHPLAGVTNVNAVLWGDYDNDGLTDVYLCRKGPNQLWRQVEQGRWSDVTGSTRTANGRYDTVDGAFFDADHDGDLDLFCVNADGPNELLNNNLDGTFRP